VSEIGSCDRPSFATMTKGSQLPVILSTMLASKLNEPKCIEMVFKTSPYMLALLDRSPWPTALCTVLPYQAPWLNPHHSRSRFSGPTARTAPIPRTFQSMSVALLFVGHDYHTVRFLINLRTPGFFPRPIIPLNGILLRDRGTKCQVVVGGGRDDI
jgi:hypothetical protein